MVEITSFGVCPYFDWSECIREGHNVERIQKEVFEFNNPAKIDAVILSHAHLDLAECSKISFSQDFQAVIYCSRATVGLLRCQC